MKFYRIWLFQQIILLSHGCGVVEVSYQSADCSNCSLELISYSTNDKQITAWSIDLETSTTVDLDSRSNFFQMNLCSQHSFMFVGIRTNTDGTSLNDIKFYALKCPQVHAESN